MAYTAAGIGFFTFALAGWSLDSYRNRNLRIMKVGTIPTMKTSRKRKQLLRVLSLMTMMTNRRKNPRTRIPTMISRMSNRCSGYFSLVP